MAEGFVNNDDLFSKDLFVKTKKDLDDFIKQVSKLDDKFVSVGNSFEDAFKKLDFSKTKDIESLNKLLEESTKATKELSQTQLENIALKKQLSKLEKDLQTLEKKQIAIKEQQAKATKKTTELTEEERKAKIKAQKENAELNKKLKEQIELEEFLGKEINSTTDLIDIGLAIQRKELKTKEEIKEANKLLAKVINQLNIEVKEEKAVIDALNETIDFNNERLDENSSKFEQSKRNVGNYTESIKEALESSDLLGKEFSDIQKGLNILINVFKKDEKEKEKQEKQQKKNTNALNENTKALKKNKKATEESADANEALGDSADEASSKLEKLNKGLKGSIIGAILAGILALASAFRSGSDGAEDFGKTMAYISGTLNAVIGTFAGLGKVIIATFKDLKNLNLNNLLNGKAFENTGKALDEFKNGVKDLPSTIKASVNSLQEFAEVNNRVNRELSLRLPLLAKLQAQEHLYIDLVDDDTLSMTTRNKLIDVSIAKTNEYFNAQVTQAKQQLFLLESQLKSEIIGKQGVKTALSNYKSLADAVQSGDKVVLGALSLDQIRSVGEALAEIATQENEFFAKKRDNDEKIRIFRRDTNERDITDLVDYTDKQFVLQEKIKASTAKNLQDRIKANNELKRLSDESFNEQLKTLDKQRKLDISASIESNKLALEGATDEKSRAKIKQDIIEKQKLLNTTLDAELLLNQANSKEYNEYIRSLGFAEKGEELLLQSIRNKIDQQQSFNDGKKEEINFTRETLDLQAEISDQQKQISEIEPVKSYDLENKTLEEIEAIQKEIEQAQIDRDKREIERQNELKANKIANLQAEIDKRKKAGEVDSIDILNAQKELNDLILENEKELTDQSRAEEAKRIEDKKKALEKQKEKQAEQIKSYVETLNAFAESFSQVFEEQRNKRLAQNEKELQKSLENQDFLRQQIIAGNADANKSLQYENEKQNEIEKRRIEEDKRKAEEELFLTGLKLYGNLVAGGENSNTAVGKTITDVEVLKLLLKGVSKFYYGTDDTGSTGILRDEYGVITGVTHKNEQVISEQERGMMGYKKTSEIIDAVRFSDNYKNGNIPIVDVSKLEAEMRLTRKAIENMPIQEIDYNTINGIITYKVKQGNKMVAKKSTLKNSYL